VIGVERFYFKSFTTYLLLVWFFQKEKEQLVNSNFYKNQDNTRKIIYQCCELCYGDFYGFKGAN